LDSFTTSDVHTLSYVNTPFEFRISVVGPDWLTGKRGDDAARELNELGEQGWQLAAVFSHPDDSLVSVILQRPVLTAANSG
jgi:hypothetical protein